MADTSTQQQAQTTGPLTAGDLTRDDVLQEVREEMGWVFLQDDMETAEQAYTTLQRFFNDNPTFRNTYPRYYKQWQDIYLTASWIMLPGMSIEQATDLFRTSLPFALKSETFELRRKLEVLLIKQMTLEFRDELRGKLRKAMLDSEAELTEAGIKKGEKLVAGTVQNWISDYNGFVGASADPTDTVRRTEYFVRSGAYRSLDEKERTVVRRCIELYEYLKLSSENPIAFEMTVPIEPTDEDEPEGVIRYGQFEPLDQRLVATYRTLLRELSQDESEGRVTPQAASTLRTEIGRSLERHRELLKQMYAAERSMLQESRAQSAPLLAVLFDDRAQAPLKVAALLALARMASLDELFADARASLYMGQKVLPQLAGATNADIDPRKDFAKQKFSPVYKKELLKALLLTALQNKEEDAAMMYQQIVNLTGGKNQQELISGSFYDVSQHQYRFLASAWKDGTLVNS